MTRFLRFCIVGCVGLAVDVAALELGVRLMGTGPWFGRGLSHLAAATVTWALNRRFTFAVEGVGCISSGYIISGSTPWARP